jgi:hypothetical protein
MYILQEKPDTHDTYVLTTWRTRQPFMQTQQYWTDPTTPEKKVSRHNPQPIDWPIRMSHPSFSSSTAIDAVGESQFFVDEQTTSVYWTHISNMWPVCSIPTHEGQPIGP